MFSVRVTKGSTQIMCYALACGNILAQRNYILRESCMCHPQEVTQSDRKWDFKYAANTAVVNLSQVRVHNKTVLKDRSTGH